MELNLPKRVDSHGVEVEVKGIGTTSFERVSVHLNAGYEFLTDPVRGEREQPPSDALSRPSKHQQAGDELLLCLVVEAPLRLAGCGVPDTWFDGVGRYFVPGAAAT